MHSKTLIILFAALAVASPAPLSQSTPGGKRGLMLKRDDDILDDDIPQQCRQACEPLLSIARGCHNQFPDRDDDDDIDDDDDCQRRSCICTAPGASVQAPQCLTCIRGLPQGQRDDDDDDDVEEIVRACNFQQQATPVGTGSAAAPAATTAAPLGPAVVVCENDDDGDDDCRTFSGSTVPATFRCDEDDGCRTSFIAAGVAAPTGVVGPPSSRTTEPPVTTSAPATGLTIVCENDDDDDRDDDRDDCRTFTGPVPSTFRCSDDDGCRTSFIPAGAAVPTTLPNTRTESNSPQTTGSARPTTTAGGIAQATPGNAAGKVAMSGVGALAIAGLAIVL